MTSQPEKLFRDKLENFQSPAPMAAWDRIEGNLDKPLKNKLWVKIAASLLLLAVAGFFIWKANLLDKSSSLTKTDNAVPKDKSTEKYIRKENTAPIIAEQTPVQKKIKSKNKTKVIEKNKPVLTEEIVIQEAPINESVKVAVVETNLVQEPTSRTIIYTAEEVNAKFLRKKLSPEATTAEKKSSGIQKLMGLAYTLKNPDTGIGDLRQKKDEILALNFLTKEDKTNKEKN
jgi:hypothetical protein